MSTVLLEGDTLHMIETKAIGVGWSKQNNLAQYAAFALPFVLFFAAKIAKPIKVFHYSENLIL